MLNPREENRKNGVTTPYSEQLSPTVNCCLLTFTFTICSLSLSNVESGRVEQKEWGDNPLHPAAFPHSLWLGRSTWRFSWEGGREEANLPTTSRRRRNAWTFNWSWAVQVSTGGFLNSKNHSTKSNPTLQSHSSSTQPHSLLSLLPVQGRAHLLRAPLPPPTLLVTKKAIEYT